MDTRISIIKDYANGSRKFLRRAMWRKSRSIAENLTALGKPVKPNTVWKMTEIPKDVTRRNIVEQTCIFLGACFMESPKMLAEVWFYLESFVAALRGGAKTFASIEEAVSELRYDSLAVERAFFRRETDQMTGLLVQLDQSLKGAFALLHIKV